MSFIDQLKQMFGGMFKQPDPAAYGGMMNDYNTERDRVMQMQKYKADQAAANARSVGIQESGQQMRAGMGASGRLSTPSIGHVESAPQPVAPAPVQPTQPVQTTNPSQFAQMLQPLADAYGVPMSVAMGQKVAENRGEPINKNNYYNLGAVDSNPTGGMQYDTPAQGIESYLKFVTGTAEESFYGNGKAGKKAYQDAFARYQQTGDDAQFLQDIQDAGYASRPDYVNFVKSTPEWNNYKKQ